MKPTKDNVQEFLSGYSEHENRRKAEQLNSKIISIMEYTRLLGQLPAAALDTTVMILVTRAQSSLQSALAVVAIQEKISMTGFAIDSLFDHPFLQNEETKRLRMNILRDFGEMAKIARNEEAARKAIGYMKNV
jgi:hypothetical protein